MFFNYTILVMFNLFFRIATLLVFSVYCNIAYSDGIPLKLLGVYYSAHVDHWDLYVDQPYLRRLLNSTDPDLSLYPQTNILALPLDRRHSDDLPFHPNSNPFSNRRGTCMCQNSIAMNPQLKKDEKQCGKPLNPRHLVHSARRSTEPDQTSQQKSQHNDADPRPGEKTRNVHFESCDCIVSD